MKNIKVDAKVFEMVLEEVVQTGESPSTIIERGIRVLRAERETPPSTGVNQTSSSQKEGIVTFVESPAFKASRTDKDKFMKVLSYVYGEKKGDFSKVLSITGRSRRYFAKEKHTLEKSGSSVYPEQIPDTPYWVITNTSTQQKKSMLRDVLQILGYDFSTIQKVIEAI